MKIGFVGMGNMAQAIAAGFIGTEKITSEDLNAYAPNQEKLEKNAVAIGFKPFGNVRDMISASDIIIIACKPYQIESVLSETKDLLVNKAIVSIAAGWVYDTFAAILGDATRIQCIMPNTPARVKEGVLLFEEKNTLNEEEDAFIKDLFESLGIVEILPTHLMGIGGAVTGCGPAFMDLVIEAYADAAVKYGISRPMAYRLVSQTMLGSAKLQLDTGKQPGVLKDEVCSPAGTTIRGVCALEKAGFRAACQDSIDAIMDMKKNG